MSNRRLGDFSQKGIVKDLPDVGSKQGAEKHESHLMRNIGIGAGALGAAGAGAYEIHKHPEAIHHVIEHLKHMLVHSQHGSGIISHPEPAGPGPSPGEMNKMHGDSAESDARQLAEGTAMHEQELRRSKEMAEGVAMHEQELKHGK